MTFQSVFWCIVTSNRLQASGNRLQDLKFKFQNPFWKAHLQSVSGNQLQYMVIDYQCKNIYFFELIKTFEKQLMRPKLIKQCEILLTHKLSLIFLLIFVCLILNSSWSNHICLTLNYSWSNLVCLHLGIIKTCILKNFVYIHSQSVLVMHLGSWECWLVRKTTRSG